MEESLPIHHSEQVHWATYDPDLHNGFLKLTLNDGKPHGYSPVPQNVVNKFVKAASHGDFFHKNIRNNTAYRYHGKVD